MGASTHCAAVREGRLFPLHHENTVKPGPKWDPVLKPSNLYLVITLIRDNNPDLIVLTIAGRPDSFRLLIAFVLVLL